MSDALQSGANLYKLRDFNMLVLLIAIGEVYKSPSGWGGKETQRLLYRDNAKDYYHYKVSRVGAGSIRKRFDFFNLMYSSWYKYEVIIEQVLAYYAKGWEEEKKGVRMNVD